jgi:hypothetical protein
MNRKGWTTQDRGALLETFAAELTSAAYEVALHHECDSSWVDLELDLWKALGETVRRWDQKSAQGRAPA